MFAGLDAGATDSVAAVARLLLQFELNPALARDYALLAYPIVNAHGFESSATPLRSSEETFRAKGATIFSCQDRQDRQGKDKSVTK